MNRRITVDGLGNARDLGGLPIRGGGTTPAGVFLRSENLDLVSDGGWAELEALGVRTLLDLRRDDERIGEVGPPSARFDVVRVDAQDAAFTRRYWDDGLSGTPIHHLRFLAETPRPTTDVLDAIATARSGTVLFHCVGGRDRTGLIAAILLAIADVEPEAIVDDYLETVRNAPAYWAMHGRPDLEPKVAAQMAARGTTTERAFRDFLDGLDVEALLTRLPAASAEALRTWRGTLP